MSVYITGDTHGKMKRIKQFCRNEELTRDDTVVILGDAGLNYFCDVRDRRAKHDLEKLAPTFLCIHGNHEERPQNLPQYKETEAFDGIAYIEEEFPNILFAKDGEVYNLEGFRCIAIGGAYSIDKHFRLAYGYNWFPDEQPSDEIKFRVKEQLDQLHWSVDVVLSHTVPHKYEPTEVFLPGIDQSSVDASTELWLEEIESKLEYRKWLAGHFHTSKTIDKLRLMFEDWVTLKDEMEDPR